MVSNRSSESDSNKVTSQEIKLYMDNIQVDGNLLITVCDKGYLDIFRLFYRINKLHQYPNFVAIVMDKEGYDVCLF